MKKKSIIVKCPANTRLQNYLLQKEIHILTPSRGRGNCGKCKVRVIEGTAKIKTNEIGRFSEEEL
ncbi:MAG: ferredoxin, partial [Bacillota bacterium]|nr:ferredoxin [Bacillota bacterium]